MQSGALQFFDADEAVACRLAGIAGGIAEIGRQAGRRFPVADPVAPRAAIEEIRAGSAQENVVAIAAIKAVGPARATQPVIAVAAFDDVRFAVAGEGVRKRRSDDAFDREVDLAGRDVVVVVGAVEVDADAGRGTRQHHEVEPGAAVDRVGSGADEEHLACRSAGQAVDLVGAVDRVHQVGLGRKRMPEPDEIAQLEADRLDRHAIRRDDFQDFVLPGDQGPGCSGGDAQRGQGMDPAPGGQVDPVGAKLEIADPVPASIGRQHEKIGPGPAEKRVGAGPVAQDIGPAVALQDFGPVTAKDHVARRAAKKRRRIDPAGLDRGQEARIDRQPGDARPFTGHEEVNPAVGDLRHHGRDIVKRKSRLLQDVPAVEQLAFGRQGHHRQPVVAAPGDDEDPVADLGCGQRLNALKPGVERVDHMIGHRQPPVRRNPDHADRRRIGRGDQKVGHPGHLDGLHGRRVSHTQALRRADHLRQSQRAVGRHRKGADHVGLQREADHESVPAHGDRCQRGDVDAGMGPVQDA